MKKKVIVEGMSCNHCVHHVTEALKELKGVVNVDVSLDTKTALVESDTEIKDEDIKFAIDDAGYEAVSIEII